MKRRVTPWALLVLSLLFLQGCGGSGSYRTVGPSVGVGLGFYHSTYGHGWGSGYYRGYDHGTVDAIDTIDAVDSLDAGGMGMPDMDMGPAMDFDF